MALVRPVPSWEAPPGTVHEPAPAGAEWRLVVGEKRCRLLQARKACGVAAVAEMNRSQSLGGENWWAYCPEHMFDRWIEDGQIWQWRVVPEPVPFAKVEALIADLEATVAWQRETYGTSITPENRPALGRLVGVEDALRMVREHLLPKGPNE